MKTIGFHLSVVAAGVLGGLLLSIPGSAVAEQTAVSAKATLPLQDVRTFTEIFGRIKSEYVEEVDDKTLLNYAIRGMLSGLDPHSSYLDEEDFRELQVGTSGEFGGLGIEVGVENGSIKVISPIDDTPAQRAGVLAGDLIIRLDDTPIKGMSLNDAVKLMRGKPGTDITLTIVRAGLDNPIELTVTRDVIRMSSVKRKLYGDGMGYVRISSFQSPTGGALENALAELKKENHGPLRGLVLDLRNNPGGVLNAAVAVSDTFIGDGLIVYTKGRADDSRLDFKASSGDALDGAPMVVLVNSGSASASEIVAGALQDHRRAVIMGEKTFGKGSVQTILPMKSTTAIKLTTARYYTPSGRSIQAKGIEPDIALDKLSLKRDDDSEVPQLTEANLSGHLENDTDLKAKPKHAKPGAGVDDYPLYEALNLLRALAIVGNRAAG
ncbi:MAG: S41 family peptidase [Chromatiales bacterium]|nr:S41 family peptidase [Chromatiales bacterium]